jgi:prefoldin subunit 5
MQKKARLMTKLPEIQKAYDIVTTLLEKASQPDQEAIIDYELADAVYARTKVTHVKTVNLWLGAGIMVEYSLKEAKVGGVEESRSMHMAPHQAHMIQLLPKCTNSTP